MAYFGFLDNSMQQEDNVYESSVLHGKFQSYLIKDEDMDSENEEEYDVSKIEESLTGTNENFFFRL